MTRWILLVLLGCALSARAADAPETTPAEASRTHCGQLVPDFSIRTTDGSVFRPSEHRGKVVLLNFWATWCPPCVAEMPHLQTEIHDRFAARDDFVMLCVSREETDAKILEFVRERGLTLPVAADTDRSVYALFAEHTIPRNVVVGRDGRILLQTIGFEREDFDKLVAVIETALGSAE